MYIKERNKSSDELKNLYGNWIFAQKRKKIRVKESSKKSKKISKKVLRFFRFSNIMQKMSAKGMKWQIAHWPVR